MTWLQTWEGDLSVKTPANALPFEGAVSHLRGAVMATAVTRRSRAGRLELMEAEKNDLVKRGEKNYHFCGSVSELTPLQC